MITPAYVRTMALYNTEMNRRWYHAAANLTDEERRQDGRAFFGSIHATMCHLLWADTMWMSRLGGWDRPPVPSSGSTTYIADFADLRTARTDADRRIEAWGDGVTEAWLGEDLVWFSGGAQREMRRPRALTIMHLFNHQTHHRGQAHALLTRLGQDPGVTDLAFVL